jgi:hypothetical protein
MRIMISRSDNFNDYDVLKAECQRIVNYVFDREDLFGYVFMTDVEIISNGDRRAEDLEIRFAKESRLNSIVMKADPADVIEYALASKDKNTMLINFFDGEEGETANIVRLAKEKGIPVWVKAV